jgi:UDPglucose 6-dehydrogenase
LRIAIVGAGYVGLVTAASFSEMGNNVICVDINKDKVDEIQKGNLPIYEPGLAELVKRNLAAGRLSFRCQLTDALSSTDILFIAVGTPAGPDGNADLTQFFDVAKVVGENIVDPLIIVDKSTVPVGTAEQVKTIIDAEIKKRGLELEFHVVSNPEFLREGSAVQDFMYPDRIVVGAESEKSRQAMETLYSPFEKKRDRLQFVGVRDAEMIKYASNAMLAMKISFINEIAVMSDYFGVDIENVRKGIGADPRIGSSFIYPGCGYGGSCFPKDTAVMERMAREAGLARNIFEAVSKRNEIQQELLLKKILQYFDGSIVGKRFAVWGLAFKPGTDDVRCAPSLKLIRGIYREGAQAVAYDPRAERSAAKELADLEVEYAGNQYEAVEEVDALIVVTEWREFRQPDFSFLKKSLREQVIFDGRNIYDPNVCIENGLAYIGIGRSSALFQ